MVIKYQYENITDDEHNMLDNLLEGNCKIAYLALAFDENDYFLSLYKNPSDNRYFISLECKPKNKPNRQNDIIFRVISKDLQTAILCWNTHIVTDELVRETARKLTGDRVSRIVINIDEV